MKNIQVTNTTIKRGNMFRTSLSSMFKDIKEKGWKIKDCKVVELTPEQVKSNYNSPDGKNQASNTRY